MDIGIVSAFCSTGLHHCKTSTCSCVCHHSPNFRDTDPEDFLNMFADFCYEAYMSRPFKVSESLSSWERVEKLDEIRGVFENALGVLCNQTIGLMPSDFMDALYETVYAHGVAPHWSRREFNERIEIKGIRSEVLARLSELKESAVQG